ncbi:hypothetical protein [cyanobacterium endosymbiont of Rhopalodia gibberula]|uniref:hypothetical protein n=1 Tax=cyanobacterium endosymbiont of Rhopalodia gibberula TaxID=1763363 RepID=UPI001E355548|nr:hypothetical protein [cyanobacterium endosymbiont of Rhopalodia gibberula]
MLNDDVLLDLLRNEPLALVSRLGIILLQYLLKMLGFSLLNRVSTIKASAQAYYNTQILGAPVGFLDFVFIGWFLGQKQSEKNLSNYRK